MTAVAAPGGVSKQVPLAIPQAWRLAWHWHWSTPSQVKVQAGSVVALACCLAGVTAALLGQLHSEFGAIGQTDAPEADSTASLYFSLNDMDAQVANLLMAGGDSVLKADRAADQASYASDLSAVSADLSQAAVAEAGNPAAQRRLSRAVTQIGRYQALAADALLKSQEAHSAAGRAPASAIAYFQQASDLMQGSILPSVDSLAAASDAHLDASYNGGESAASAGLVEAAVLTVLLLAALVTLQVYLAVQYRRLVNPALAAATLLVLVAGATTGSRFYGEYTHLHVARYDSFASVQALTMALGVSQDANADESRYLVDPARAAQYRQAFLAKSQQVASVGPATLSSYAPVLQADIVAYQGQAYAQSYLWFGGYLGTELRNITFPGEREAATRALLAYGRYQQDDATLRATARTNLAGAVSYDMGTAPGQSDGDFTAYATALRQVIAINQGAFTRAVADGSSDASATFLVTEALALLLLAALIYVGVRPRLAEYRR